MPLGTDFNDQPSRCPICGEFIDYCQGHGSHDPKHHVDRPVACEDCNADAVARFVVSHSTGHGSVDDIRYWDLCTEHAQMVHEGFIGGDFGDNLFLDEVLEIVVGQPT